MKTLKCVPLAALFIAACADPTAVPNDILSPDSPALASGAPISAPPAGNTFESGSASATGWTPATLTTSPGTSSSAPTTFLGRFTNEVVTLDVPAGMKTVTISFDLYVIGSWDGSGKQGSWGTDGWQIESQLSDGVRRNVFNTSFSNQGVNTQHYPREVTASGTSPAMRGASATNSLGYPFKGPRAADATDATYRLTFTVKNPSGEAMKFLFHSGGSLQLAADESWGLDNVSVTGS